MDARARYPAPEQGLVVEPFAASEHDLIVEPFVGSASYATRYPDHDVVLIVLIERAPHVAALWRWLVGVSVDEVMGWLVLQQVARLTQAHASCERSSQMSRVDRLKLIQALQEQREGRVTVTYVTSTRTGHSIPMADDVVRWLYEFLEQARDTAKEKGVDLFIYSDGGQGTAPWRIVNIIREYTEKFDVLVPHRAFSAATLTALGANNIVMHKMGCLGPIDPSVANIFNPPHPHIPGQAAPISVEDVSAYFRLVKDDVGITHEDELVQSLLALTEKVHPLALGNVHRHHNQSRMMARKLLMKHMSEQKHEIELLIDTLKSNLFFHGHPINRREAKEDLKLKVTFADGALADAMWALYCAYEDDLKLTSPFSPQHELETQLPQPPALTTEAIVAQINQLAPHFQGVPMNQLVDLAAAMVPHVTQPRPVLKLDGMLGAFCESEHAGYAFKTDMTLERVTIPGPSGPQDGVRQEVRWQRWEKET